MSTYELNAFYLVYSCLGHRKVLVTQNLLFLCRLIKYDRKEYARIGVMPRYGNANSIKWFEVEPNCTFHIINSFEDGDEASC